MTLSEVLDPMTESSRGLRPFRNRCLRTIAPRTENEGRTGCGSQESGRSRGSIREDLIITAFLRELLGRISRTMKQLGPLALST